MTTTDHPILAGNLSVPSISSTIANEDDSTAVLTKITTTATSFDNSADISSNNSNSSNNNNSSSNSKNTVPPSPTPEWGTNVIHLKDYALKGTIPGFAKINKGNYMTLGSSKFSFTKQHHDIYIHSIKMAVKVLAHSVRRVETAGVSKRTGHTIVSRMYAVDQRLAIPITYQGWFELLSEDGKSARPIPTVHELSKVRPKRFLIRENTKAYIINDENNMTFDQTRIVLAGEHLTLSGDVSLPSPDKSKKVKLLRCFSSKGDRLYLSFDQKGMFTPIAEENDVTGVFSIRDVVKRFRLPLTVKLVQGMRPKVDPTRFTGIIRLDWVYTDETAFVCPIVKNQIKLLPVPTDVHLQLVSAVNQQAMKSTELYKSMSVKCGRMISNYNNTIHLIVNLPDAASKGKGKVYNSNMFSVPLVQNSEMSSSRKPRSEAKQNRLMDQIDDLYGYVRDGGAIPHKFEYDSDEESFWEEPAYEPLDEFRARLVALEAGEKVTYNSKYEPEDLNEIGLMADTFNKDDSDSTYGVLNGAPQNPRITSTTTNTNVNMSTKQQPPPLPPRQYTDLDLTPVPPPSLPPDLVAAKRPSFERNGSSSNNGSDGDQGGSTRNPSSATGDGGVSGGVGVVSAGVRRQSSQSSQYSHGTVTSQQQGISTKTSIPNPVQARPRTSSSSSNPKSIEYQRRNSRDSDDLPRQHARSGGVHRNPSKMESDNERHNRRLFSRDFRDSDISLATKGSSSSSGDKKGNARKKLQTLYL